MKKIPYREARYKSKGNYKTYLSGLLEDSESIALNTLYPFLEDFEKISLPSKYYNWQIRACLELHKWQGDSGIKSYSENGISWTRATDGDLSQSLLEELEPSHVGIPKRKEVTDDN